jgi:hypothetical protein
MRIIELPPFQVDYRIPVEELAEQLGFITDDSMREKLRVFDGHFRERLARLGLVTVSCKCVFLEKRYGSHQVVVLPLFADCGVQIRKSISFNGMILAAYHNPALGTDGIVTTMHATVFPETVQKRRIGAPLIKHLLCFAPSENGRVLRVATQEELISQGTGYLMVPF